MGKNEDENNNGGTLASVASTIKWLVIAGIVVFFIVELTAFKNSPITKQLQNVFGGVGALLLWFSAHPSLIVGIVFTVLLAPVLGIVLKGTFSFAQDMRNKVKKARELEDAGELPEDPDVVGDAVLQVTASAATNEANNMSAVQAENIVDATVENKPPLTETQQNDANETADAMESPD